MKVSRKMKNRLIVALMMLVMGVGELNPVGGTVYADGEKTITGLGTGAITNPVEQAVIIYEDQWDEVEEKWKWPAGTEWTGSYVYYGKYKNQPVKYRVLDKDSDDFGVTGGSILLDCDTVLDSKGFDESTNIWADSEIRLWLNGTGFLGNTNVFTEAEKTAIAPSTKAAPTEGDADISELWMTYSPLSNDKVFLLDLAEILRKSYGYSPEFYPVKNRMKGDPAGCYWLRSYENSYYGPQNGYILSDGDWYADTPDRSKGVSPAFNLSLSSVIFSSLVNRPLGDVAPEFKLTVKDSGLTIAAASCEIDTDHKVTIPYAITDKSADAAPDRVSVVVTDGTWTDNGWSAGAKLLQYEKLETDSFGLYGNGSFVLDTGKATGNWGTDYHVYVLAEDVRESKESDLASVPVEITDLSGTTEYQVSFDLNGKGGTTLPSQTLSFLSKVTEPTGIAAVTGYLLEGWYSDPALTTKWNYASDVVTGNMTLYAKWVPISYTIKYEANKPADAKEEVSGSTADSTHIYDEEKALNANGYSIKGYAFDGWNTKADGSGDSYADKATVKNLTATDGATFTLYAKWKKEADPTDPTDPADPTDPDPVVPDTTISENKALDPVPDIIPGVTKELYLVQGQKFNIGSGWYLDKTDADYKTSKKVVSISKKGAFKAKKTGTATITCDSEGGKIKLKVVVSKPAFKDKKIKLEIPGWTAGQVLLNYDKEHLDVLYFSSAPDVVTVDIKTGALTAAGKGTAKVTAYINGSAYSCTVTVKENNPAVTRTMHMAVNTTKAIGVKGVKGWVSASENVVKIANKAGTKVKATAAGRAILNAEANGTKYRVDVFAEDLTIKGDKVALGNGKNKYTIDLKKGETTDLVFSDTLDQRMIFKSSKPDVAFVDANGHVVARSAGKGKFTTKIDGKSITITVVVSE